MSKAKSQTASVTKSAFDAPPAKAKLSETNSPIAPRAASKTDLLTKVLSKKGGATIQQLCDVTGWQSHSVRAALTGLKKKGVVITRSKTDGKSVYAIAGIPEPDASSPEVTA